MSDKKNSSVPIGGLLLGLGAAAGVGYLLYDMMSSKTTETPVSVAPPRRSITAAEPPPGDALLSNTCQLCQRDLSDEATFSLNCSHSFHKNCILSNYILHYNDPQYLCPISACQMIISPNTIRELSE